MCEFLEGEDQAVVGVVGFGRGEVVSPGDERGAVVRFIGVGKEVDFFEEPGWRE